MMENKKDRIGPYSFTHPEKGRRPTADPFLLSKFVLPIASTEETILDIGTGSGVIPLLTAANSGASKIVGVEV
ncbi:MAG: hypothetical protein V3T30_00135, partial [Thermodesulfobacteriota bacterium]